MSEWKFRDALRSALVVEMRRDPTVFLAGIDVGTAGGIFAITRGLFEEFGADRVRDTPISEMALLGMAVGAAMAGYRPVVELMFMDFIGVALDPLLNQAAKLRYMTGGAVEIPLVVRTQVGAGGSSAAQHSQSLEVLVAHIPGLRVVMPGTPDDAARLLRSAIRDPHPVVFVENRRLYGMRGPQPDEFPEPEPLGRAIVRRSGDDVTLVTYSRMLSLSLEAADALASDGISIEVVDLRTISPLDMDSVLESVRRTGRLMVVHEAVRDFGVGAEIVAQVCGVAMDALKAAPVRLGGLFTPIPFAPELESSWLPSVASISKAARALAAT